MVKITKVSVKNNYRLELTFDNGVCGVVDEKNRKRFFRHCAANRFMPEISHHNPPHFHAE